MRGVALPGRRTEGALGGQPARQPLPKGAPGPYAVAVGGDQGSACAPSFLSVAVTTSADALALSVQVAYLHCEIPAAVIVIYRQTRTRQASLTSRFRIHTATSPADLHTSLGHLPHLHTYRVR
ncbi:hypothetical protein GCM10010176_020100 [Nonomuraea spiralis]|nr:hypothetical protein GCM10010176_020100 [Nonomuraea spiralis]